jgi:hypothetical protein
LDPEHYPGEHMGAVIALDPRTGEVLAMVSKPAFDPNLFATRISGANWSSLISDPGKPLQNRVIQSHFSPGSVFKVFMAAAGLETGVLNPLETIYCPGHATFYGIGAYTAGLISKFGWGEPISGLIVAAAVAGLVGFAVSFVIARFRHFTLIMITLGLGLLAFETANRAHWLTGGSDGLQGMSIWPVLGLFKFDLYGYTAYAYSLAVLFLVFLGTRRLINSPFGLALRGIRENWIRMPAIGADSRAHIRKAYTIAAAIAGLAGAVLAQTTENVSLESISFQRSQLRKLNSSTSRFKVGSRSLP